MVHHPLISSITSPPFFLSLAASISQHVPISPVLSSTHLARRASDDHHGRAFITGIILMPILVILSGIFAGLTLGYMSLDETQLHVLSISGTPCVVC
jgi:metal transporter CNNM